MSPAQEAVIRAWTRAQVRARRAYYGDMTEEQIRLSADRRIRKAAAQKRYRDRVEAERREQARTTTLQERGTA